MKIDKDSKVPLHYQIYTNLLDKIKSGVYLPNEKLPPESELERIYGVSRITVRGAMQLLEQDGYVKKSRGIGTTVCELKKKFDLQHLSSFSADISKQGERANSILLAFDIVSPEEHIASALRLKENEAVYYIERSRLRGDMIVGLHRAYIKRMKGLILGEDDFTQEASLYALLEKEGIHLKHATELLEARTPSSEVCKKLQIKKDLPVFYKERTTYDEENEPVEYVEIFYRSDIYQYRVSLDLDN